jgi:hypothetical protein
LLKKYLLFKLFLSILPEQYLEESDIPGLHLGRSHLIPTGRELAKFPTAAMVNFMHQLDWAKGCPDSCQDILSECLLGCFWKRLALGLVGRVKY